MAESQFLKRMKKLQGKELDAKVDEPRLGDSSTTETSPLVEETVEPAYTEEAYDVYPDGKGNFNIATIEYNPETKEAKVSGIYNITRLVGLTYTNHKTSLKILRKKKTE